MRFYEKRFNRLVYCGLESTPEYWDEHWAIDTSIRERIIRLKSTFVTRITKRYLKPEDGPILEGGCGYGQHVAALFNNGYQCIGVDYAPETVSKLNEALPELDVRLGDVRRLDFEAKTFAGYWSLGVIEHFWEGYQEIGLEIARLLKPGGYLFLTFPSMSPLRRLKAALGCYQEREFDQTPPDFYQFVFDYHQVLENFKEYGFYIIKSHPIDGIKGLKSEINRNVSFLQRLYNYRGSSLVIRGIRYILSIVLLPVAGHSMYMVLKRSN